MPSLVAKRDLLADRYIRSLQPVFWVDLSKRDGDSFLSDDAAGRLCTPSGTTRAGWRFLGRNFNGVDDVVTVPDGQQALATSKMTVLVWLQFNSLAADGTFVSKKNTTFNQANGWHFYYNSGSSIIQARGSGATLATSATLSLTTGQFYFFGWHVVGTASQFTMYGNTIFTSVNPIESIVANADSLRIGELSNDFPSWMNGLISQVVIFNRDISLQEDQTVFLATRHRYQ